MDKPIETRSNVRTNMSTNFNRLNPYRAKWVGKKPMLRRKATQVLREICECSPDNLPFRYICLIPLNPDTATTEDKMYNLQIGLSMDRPTRSCMKNVTRKLGLSFREFEGRVVVSDINKEPREELAIVA